MGQQKKVEAVTGDDEEEEEGERALSTMNIPEMGQNERQHKTGPPGASRCIRLRCGSDVNLLVALNEKN